MTEKELAVKMIQSWRGQYIIGQALYLAIQAIEETEPSNAEDMRLMMKHLFPLFADIKQAEIVALSEGEGAQWVAELKRKKEGQAEALNG